MCSGPKRLRRLVPRPRIRRRPRGRTDRGLPPHRFGRTRGVTPSSPIARRAGLAVLTVAAGTSLAACSPSEARRSREPGELRIAVPADVGPINPYSGSAESLLGLVYDNLFEPSPYVLEPFPALAERAERIDNLTWRVTLRAGVRWHDGTPFSAEDVVFTYLYYRDGPVTRYSHHVSDVPRIDRIVAEDALVVRFECGYPCPTLARITLADLPIIPAHVWRGVTEPRAYQGLPVGTGPYRLVEYRPNRLYRFEANPDYHLGTASFRRLTVPVVPSAASALLALRTGEIDATRHELPPELEREFAGMPGIGIMRTSSLSIVELRPNFRKPPFDDPIFRRALSLAIDRERLVELVLLGRGRPGTRGYPHPDSPWTNPDLMTLYDAGAAAEALERVGFVDRDGDGVRETPGGRALRFGVTVRGSEPGEVRAAELVAGQLRRVGIALSVEALESTAFDQRERAADFDLIVWEVDAHGVADPDQFVMSHRSGYLWSRDIPYPAWDSLFDAWKAAPTVDARTAVSFRMQTLVNRQPTSIALYYPDQAWAFRTEAHDGWRESLGYGIIHKWSLVGSPDGAGAAGRPPSDLGTAPPP